MGHGGPTANSVLMDEVLARVEDGSLWPAEPSTHPLADAGVALRELLERRVSGKVCLTPEVRAAGRALDRRRPDSDVEVGDELVELIVRQFTRGALHDLAVGVEEHHVREPGQTPGVAGGLVRVVEQHRLAPAHAGQPVRRRVVVLVGLHRGVDQVQLHPLGEPTVVEPRLDLGDLLLAVGAPVGGEHDHHRGAGARLDRDVLTVERLPGERGRGHADRRVGRGVGEETSSPRDTGAAARRRPGPRPVPAPRRRSCSRCCCSPRS